jgi:protein-disulfide isomerase
MKLTRLANKKETLMSNIRQALQIFFGLILCSFALLAQADSIKSLFRTPGDPVLGNPNGKVTIVEFFDYQCSHCISMAPVMKAIIQANPDVRVVYKELPIRGPVSEYAAKAALAANQQGQYQSFNHALLAASQPLSEKSILEIAEKTGMDMKKFKSAVGANRVSEQLAENEKLARELQLTGTPAFFIGKTDASNQNDVIFVLGQMSQPELQKAIDQMKS